MNARLTSVVGGTVDRMRGLGRKALMIGLFGLSLCGAWSVAGQEEAAPEGGEVHVTNCPAPTFRAQLFTSRADRIPRDAPLVVGLEPGGALRELPTVQLTRRRRNVPLIREAIAPGLFRLRADAPRPLYGRYTVAGVEGSPDLLFSRGTLPGPPVQPRLDRLERYVVASASGSRTELRAHFGFPIPVGIVAVLSFWGPDDDPDLFARAVPTSAETVLWSSRGSCSVLPMGASEPPTQGTVRVAFVDQFGQISPPSAPLPLAAH